MKNQSEDFAELMFQVRLRAIEWISMPSFSSQVYFPILILFVKWYWVILSVLVLDALWNLTNIYITTANYFLARRLCLFINYTKYPSIITSVILLCINHNYLLAFLVLTYPITSGFVNVFNRKLEPLQEIFIKQLGLS